MTTDSWKKMTKKVWMVFWLGLLVYELVVLLFGPKGALLTPIGIAFLSAHLWAGFALGVLIGHFVLLRRSWMPWPPPPWWGLGALLGLLALLFGADYGLHWVWPVEASVAPGALLGHAFWAQDPPKA